MTIASATTPMRARYVSTAGQTVFSVPFPIYDEADFEVYVNGALMTYDVTPANATEYSIGAFEAASTNITFGSPGLSDGDDVLLVNDIPVERTSDFASSGVFPITTLNKQLDKLTAMIREREDFTDMRVLRLAKTDFPETLAALPVKATRASKLMAFDANGDPTVATQTITELEAWFDGAEAAATAAAASETAAGASETAAAASAAAAATSETNAAASQAAAAASETAAASSQTAAASSESAAAASASAAASSASSASTSATNASNSASSAADSLAATLAAYDNFDDRYLGAKAADPTLDNDGNALIAGALYFNTTFEVMKVYTGAVWVAAYVTGGDFLPLVGGTMIGALTLSGDPTNALHAATKQYVDAAKADILDGFTSTGTVKAQELLLDVGTKTGLAYETFRNVWYHEGVARVVNETSALHIEPTMQFSWRDTGGAGPAAGRDTGLARDSAGVVKVTDGSTGQGSIWAYEYKMNIGAISAGIYSTDGYIISFKTNGTVQATLNNAAEFNLTGAGKVVMNGGANLSLGITAFEVRSDWVMQWSASTTAISTKDTGLARDSAGVLKVTNGSTGKGKLIVDDGTAADHAATKGQLDTGLATKAASSHTHAISDVTGLQTALDAKATPADIQDAVHKSVRWVSNVDYTLVLDDLGRSVILTGLTVNRTLTIPPNSSVAFPVGTRINVGCWSGTYKVTVAPGSGVTLNSKSSLRDVNGFAVGATLEKIGTNDWWLVGDLS